MIKVLFFSNIPTQDKKSIGGATVLANKIYIFIKKQNNIKIDHVQIRTNWKKFGQVFDYVKWVIKAPFIFFKYDVISIHATSDFHFTIAPIIWFWAKIQNKKIIYHFFGGVFFDYFNKKNRFLKFLIKKTILQSDTIFVETKTMINNMKKGGIVNCVWLPNSRELPKISIKKKEFNNRFIFISKVTKTKGIDELLQVSSLLPEHYLIDIYGPLDNNFYTEQSFNNYKAHYKGVLNNEDVPNVLNNYDVLILPTYHDGEGYPGIIIESLSLGIPVITTNWRSLNEIITNNNNGILITPKNIEELLNAIKFFNLENYQKFRKSAFASFYQFSSNVVFSKIIKSYLK